MIAIPVQFSIKNKRICNKKSIRGNTGFKNKRTPDKYVYTNKNTDIIRIDLFIFYVCSSTPEYIFYFNYNSYFIIYLTN